MSSSRYYKFKKISKEERIKRLKILFFFIAILVCLLSISWLIFLSPFFEIKTISIVSENIYVTSENVAEIMSRITTFGLSNNILLLSNKRLNSELAAAFPSITDIIVAKKLFHTVTIDFNRRIQIGIWCHPMGGQPQVDNCYYVDKDGIIFAKTQIIQGNLILKIEDQSKNNVSLGDRVLNNDQMNFILAFNNKIAENNKFKILKFKIKPNSSVELEAITDKNWSIYLDEKQNPTEAVNNLLSILEEAIKNIENLEYIDLRILNRVFYKLK